MKCQRCQNELSEQSKYCPNCGHNLKFDISDKEIKFKAFNDKKISNKNVVSEEKPFPTTIKIFVVISLCVICVLAVVLMILIYISDVKNANNQVPVYINSSSISKTKSDELFDFPSDDKKQSDAVKKITIGEQDYNPGEYLVSPTKNASGYISVNNKEYKPIEEPIYMNFSLNDMIKLKNVQITTGVKNNITFGKKISGQFKVGVDIEPGEYTIKPASGLGTYNISKTNAINSDTTKWLEKSIDITLKSSEYIYLYNAIIVKK